MLRIIIITWVVVTSLLMMVISTTVMHLFVNNEDWVMRWKCVINYTDGQVHHSED